VTQEHRRRRDGPERIGDAAIGDVRGGAVNRLVQADARIAQRRSVVLFCA